MNTSNLKIGTLLLFTFFISTTFQIQAKKKYLIDFVPDGYVELNINNRNFYIVNVNSDISDSLKSFGFVKTGIFNKERSVGFKSEPSELFLKYLSHQGITKNTGDSLIPVTLVIKNVLFDERVQIGGEIGTALLELEYLDLNGNTIYSTITRDTHKGIQVTFNLDILLQNCINKSLLVFNLFDKQNKKFAPDDSGGINILVEQMEKGFYGSFQEVKYNRPQFKYNFVIHNLDDNKFSENGKTNNLTVEIKDSLLNSNYKDFFSSIYGFCDGKNVFIKEKANATRFGFVKITPNERYIVYEGRMKGLNFGAAGVGVVIGGLIGGAVVGGISSVAGTKLEIIMDLKTGEAHSFNPNSLLYFMKKNESFFEYFKRYPKLKEENIDKWLNYLNQVSKK